MSYRLFAYRKVNGEFITESAVMEGELLDVHRAANRSMEVDDTVIMCWLESTDPNSTDFVGFGPVWKRASNLGGS